MHRISIGYFLSHPGTKGHCGACYKGGTGQAFHARREEDCDWDCGSGTVVGCGGLSPAVPVQGSGWLPMPNSPAPLVGCSCCTIVNSGQIKTLPSRSHGQLRQTRSNWPRLICWRQLFPIRMVPHLGKCFWLEPCICAAVPFFFRELHMILITPALSRSGTLTARVFPCALSLFRSWSSLGHSPVSTYQRWRCLYLRYRVWRRPWVRPLWDQW